jgi:hypothetical protein
MPCVGRPLRFSHLSITNVVFALQAKQDIAKVSQPYSLDCPNLMQDFVDRLYAERPI